MTLATIISTYWPTVPLGVLAYLYVVWFTRPDYVLFSWYKIVSRIIGPNRNGTHNAEPINWLWKPIIGCERCVSGQLGLWHYLYDNLSAIRSGEYDFIEHIFYITLSIFVTDVITRRYENQQKRGRR